jgi:long-chain acyl-CoA synthetase
MPTLFQNGRRDFTNLVHVLQAAVDTYKDRPLFGVMGPSGVSWTSFRQFSILVDQFRAGLASLGVKRGDAVAVISNNRLEWAVGSHACFGLGAAYVPMYEAQLDTEWQYILRDSDAVLCLAANAGIAQRVQALRSELPQLRNVVNFEAPLSDATSYAGLMAHGRANPLEPCIPEGEDVASLIYTSGTTGKPKGVILTHQNLSANVNSMLELVDIAIDDRGVAFLPWAHVFGGCVELNLALATGCSTGICGDASKLGEFLAQVKPTFLFAVPRVWNKIHAGVVNLMAEKPPAIQWMFNTALEAKQKLRQGKSIGLRERAAIAGAEKLIFPKILEKFGGNLRFAVSGAAALPREVAEFMESLGIQVHEGYGLTETGGTATAQPKDAVRLGSVGKAVPGVRIVLDKTAPGATADEGEVILYGKNIMRGYHKRAEESSEAVTPDGGLRTGDLGRVDADGYLFITGRAKELYKLENGKYVAPVPLEQQLELSPYIGQAIVYGDNKPHNVALIIPDFVALETWAKGQQITGTRESLLEHPRVLALLEAEVEKCNKRCKGFERVVDFLIDTEELTSANGMLTQTMKPKRRSIMGKYGHDIEALYPKTESMRPSPRASYIRELRPDAGARNKVAQGA